MKVVTRKQARQLHEEIEETLQPLAKKHNVVIGVGGGRFSATSYSCKVTVLVGEDANVPAGLEGVSIKWIKSYKDLATIYGLPKDGLGKTIKIPALGEYTIVGFRPKAKCQVVARKGNNKMFNVFTVDAVKNALKS